MERLTDEEFVKEMSIVWQGLSTSKRNDFATIIRNQLGDIRSTKIISRMQEKIE